MDSIEDDQQNIKKLKDEEDQNFKEEEQKIIDELYKISEANLTLKKLEEYLNEINLLKYSIDEDVENSQKYFKLDGQLLEERQIHQEDIKEIDENITTLIEKCLKPLQQKCLAQKNQMSKHDNTFVRKLNEIEHKLTTNSTPVGRQITSNQMIFPQHLMLQTFLQQQLQQHIQQQLHLQQATQTRQQHHLNWTTPISNLLAKHHQQRNNLSNIHPAKMMKKCQHCQNSIHRNAPTCPLCKQKIVSKTTKRIKK